MARLTKRRRVFYPKNEQTLGLYTQGKEWMLVEGDKEYKGPYHKFSDGVVMTGATPEKTAKYLTEYKDVSKIDIRATEIYRSITTEKVNKYISPQYYYPIVRPNDVANGYIERYFVQKKNEQVVSTIIEIDKTQFGNVRLKNGVNINGKVYQKFLIRWVITGSEKDIKDKNRSTLSTFERRHKGIKQYLGVLSELSKYSPITSD